MKLIIALTPILLSACSALPRSLPPEQFNQRIARGDYSTQQRTTTKTLEYRYGIPTGRTWETR